jgi:DNA polymerase-3 subunit epsilon
MSMDFVAVDIETANPSMASICQVGVAGFSDGAVSFEWVSYVDPQD